MARASRLWPALVLPGLLAGCGDDIPPMPRNSAPTACFTVTPPDGSTATTFVLDRCAVRSSFLPVATDYDVGFRCARTR